VGLLLVQGPATDPISLAEARAHCRIDIDDDDGLLAGYILAARQHVEDYIRRPLITQTFDLTIDYGWPQNESSAFRWCSGSWYDTRIILPRTPVQSITYIKYVDTSGVLQTLSSSQYVGPTLLDVGDYAITPAYGVTLPQARYQLAAITVRFVAGYGSNPGDVPEPIRQAILLMIGHWYENREAASEKSISAVEFGVEALLYPFRTRLI